jgi:hypothetical protein
MSAASRPGAYQIAGVSLMLHFKRKAEVCQDHPKGRVNDRKGDT